MKTISIILLSCLLGSCYKQKSKLDSSPTNSAISNNTLIGNTKDNTKYNFSFLDNYILKELPTQDTTDFNNYKPNKFLTKEQIDLLGLRKRINTSSKFSINYRLNLSPKFTTIVISYELSVNELNTILLNYDKNFHIIDCIDIAYDEIAESFLQKKSQISKSEIIVKDIDSSCGKSEIKTTIYKISNNGNFIKNK